MCGFTIIIKKNKNKKIIFENKSLKHRGPDAFNRITYKNTIFNHWRLSIFDRSKLSNQPVVNKNFIFVYNGEVYNYKNFSKKEFNKTYKSDTLFLFEILNKYKNLNFLKKISGFYSYAYLNKKKNSLIFSRDEIGKKPLYYYYDDQIFILSSEEKGIFPYIKKKIDEKSIIEYFFFRNLHYGKTFYKNIYQICPGEVMSFDINKWFLNKRLDWSEFYKRKIFTNKNKKFDQKKFLNNLNKSIENRHNSDTSIQLALSGGYDSTLILNLISLNQKIKNFIRSIGISFDKENNENAIAKYTSKILKKKFFGLKFKSNYFNTLSDLIKNNDGPIDHPSSIGLDAICKEASKLDKVLITGEGADDLFFGYDHYKKEKIKSFAFRSFLKKKDIEKIIKYKENKKILKLFNKHFKTNKDINQNINAKFYSREMEFKTHLQSLLKRNDRVGMKNSIEIRCPFLDFKLIKLIPSKLFIKKQKLFKNYLFTFTNNEFLKRKKIGFYVPLNKLYNNKNRTNKFMKLAQIYLKKNHFHIRKTFFKNSEVKWLLLNIGIFLNQNQK